MGEGEVGGRERGERQRRKTVVYVGEYRIKKMAEKERENNELIRRGRRKGGGGGGE